MDSKIENRIKSLKSLITFPNVNAVKTSEYPVNEKRTIYTIDVETDGG